MRARLLLSLIALTITFSCKEKSENDEKVSTEVSTKEANSIQLTNYSDENWKNGVGLTYNMLLVDYTPENLNLISKGTQLNLPDGDIVPYVAYEKKDNFIQIMLGDKKPTDYQGSIEYPNEIIIK